jgi:DNA-binding HxlR family transcriptional regulator
MDVSVQLSDVRKAMPDQYFDQNCPSRVILDHVMSKWGVLILCSLAGRIMRWGELRRAVGGVSEKMLAQTLQTLERDGLVRRDAHPVVPPHVEYSLTDLGQELVTHLLPLMAWLQANAPAMVGEPAKMIR